ncbi:MAG TPA: zinc ribbon domain-containing protein [Spirochaetes bacterium]|nr:zinc ribbon domain-containing protein [Spirochaetota bacterium]
MPIYEYHCEDCSETFTELRKFNDESPALCPSCGSKKTRKKISVFSSGKPSASCSPSGGG